MLHVAVPTVSIEGVSFFHMKLAVFMLKSVWSLIMCHALIAHLHTILYIAYTGSFSSTVLFKQPITPDSDLQTHVAPSYLAVSCFIQFFMYTTACTILFIQHTCIGISYLLCDCCFDKNRNEHFVGMFAFVNSVWTACYVTWVHVMATASLWLDASAQQLPSSFRHVFSNPLFVLCAWNSIRGREGTVCLLISL